MAIIAEGKHAGEFLVSEANGMRSREEITIAAEQTLVAGHVLGLLTAGGYAEYNNGSADGSEVAVAILLDAVTTGVGETAQAVAFVRDCEVNLDELTWFTGAVQGDIDDGVADLAAAGIIARPSI